MKQTEKGTFTLLYSNNSVRQKPVALHQSLPKVQADETANTNEVEHESARLKAEIEKLENPAPLPPAAA